MIPLGTETATPARRLSASFHRSPSVLFPEEVVPSSPVISRMLPGQMDHPEVADYLKKINIVFRGGSDTSKNESDHNG